MLACEVDFEQSHVYNVYLTSSKTFQELKKASLLVYANKQDLKGAMSAAEISHQLNLTSIKEQGWHIQGCCALTGEGWLDHITYN